MSKVDIIKKHIGSEDFYDLNGTETLRKILAAMDEYAQEQVKLFAIPDVINRRELLIDFIAYIDNNLELMVTEGTDKLIDNYLKSINCL